MQPDLITILQAGLLILLIFVLGQIALSIVSLIAERPYISMRKAFASFEKDIMSFSVVPDSTDLQNGGAGRCITIKGRRVKINYTVVDDATEEVVIMVRGFRGQLVLTYKTVNKRTQLFRALVTCNESVVHKFYNYHPHREQMFLILHKARHLWRIKNMT